MTSGFGTTSEPVTERASSQQAAGIIHWQCGISASPPARRPLQPLGPAAAEAISATRPAIKVMITIHCIARWEACTVTETPKSGTEERSAHGERTGMLEARGRASLRESGRISAEAAQSGASAARLRDRAAGHAKSPALSRRTRRAPLECSSWEAVGLARSGNRFVHSRRSAHRTGRALRRRAPSCDPDSSGALQPPAQRRSQPPASYPSSPAASTPANREGQQEASIRPSSCFAVCMRASSVSTRGDTRAPPACPWRANSRATRSSVPRYAAPGLLLVL